MPNRELVKALAVTAELTGTKLSEPAARMILDDLAGFEEGAVLAALHRCRLELRFPLTLGAIIDRLDDGHPGPETAWALVGQMTEDDTVVWTQEIAEVWDTVRHLEDRVAARMAFLEQYRVALGRARAERRRPQWAASLGLDPAKREAALRAAEVKGKLSPAAVRAALPPQEPVNALAEGSMVERAQVRGLVRELEVLLALDRRAASDRWAAHRPESPAMEHDPLFKLSQEGRDGRDDRADRDAQ